MFEFILIMILFIVNQLPLDITIKVAIDVAIFITMFVDLIKALHDRA